MFVQYVVKEPCSKYKKCLSRRRKGWFLKSEIVTLPGDAHKSRILIFTSAFSSTGFALQFITSSNIVQCTQTQNISHKKFTRKILYQNSAYFKHTPGLDLSSHSVKDKLYISILKRVGFFFVASPHEQEVHKKERVTTDLSSYPKQAQKQNDVVSTSKPLGEYCRFLR